MNYYVEYWDCNNEERNNEVINVINSNINSNLFSKIFVYSKNKEPRINSEIINSDRITYQFIFDNSEDGINILANSDILFNETIKLVKNISDTDFYALTRYECNNMVHKYDDPYKGSDSQDVWIWKNKCKIKNANFYLGLPGCDNKIAYYAKIHNYDVKNPALSIKTYHEHRSNVRDGSSCDLSKRLPPPYALIPVGSL